MLMFGCSWVRLSTGMIFILALTQARSGLAIACISYPQKYSSIWAKKPKILSFSASCLKNFPQVFILSLLKHLGEFSGVLLTRLGTCFDLIFVSAEQEMGMWIVSNEEPVVLFMPFS